MVDRPAVRFEAKVLAGPRRLSLRRVADFDLDRIPDPDGEVRVLIGPEEAQELVAQGYEVLLLRSQPVQPLDPQRVSDDDSVRSWLEEQTRGVERQKDA